VSWRNGLNLFLHWVRRDYPPPSPSEEAQHAKRQAEHELIRLEALELEVQALERHFTRRDPRGAERNR
jgi:hypothetical protein